MVIDFPKPLHECNIVQLCKCYHNETRVLNSIRKSDGFRDRVNTAEKEASTEWNYYRICSDIENLGREGFWGCHSAIMAHDIALRVFPQHFQKPFYYYEFNVRVSRHSLVYIKKNVKKFPDPIEINNSRILREKNGKQEKMIEETSNKWGVVKTFLINYTWKCSKRPFVLQMKTW